MPQCSQLPARAGVGLKPEHYAALLDACRGGGDFLGDWCPQWVEVHPQNYFCKGGPPHRWLTEVASEMPLSFHSTALSLGSADGPDDAELDQLAALVSRYQPASISDHLSWSNTGPSGAGGEKFPDLLPVPYTRAALAILQRNVDMVQNRLARRILIENPSRYLSFADDEMDEVDFIGQLCAETGCGLLLDINNIEVSATNLGSNICSSRILSSTKEILSTTRFLDKKSAGISLPFLYTISKSKVNMASCSRFKVFVWTLPNFSRGR